MPLTGIKPASFPLQVNHTSVLWSSFLKPFCNKWCHFVSYHKLIPNSISSRSSCLSVLVCSLSLLQFSFTNVWCCYWFSLRLSSSVSSSSYFSDSVLFFFFCTCTFCHLCEALPVPLNVLIKESEHVITSVWLGCLLAV